MFLRVRSPNLASDFIPDVKILLYGTVQGGSETGNQQKSNSMVENVAGT